MHGQGGFTLDRDTIERIAQLGVSLGLDLYPPYKAGLEPIEVVPN